MRYGVYEWDVVREGNADADGGVVVWMNEAAAAEVRKVLVKSRRRIDGFWVHDPLGDLAADIETAQCETAR